MKKIDICYASSDEYSIHTGISLFSLLKYNSTLINDIYMLDYGISEENRKKIDEVCLQFGHTCHYIDALPILEKEGSKNGLQRFRGSYATYSRAFIDKLLPETVDRLFYIDSDTVILGSIEGIIDFNMAEKVLAGCVCCSYYGKKNGRGRSDELDLLTHNQAYITCGMLLFSLENWKKFHCSEMIEATCKIRHDYRFADQTLINNAIPEQYFGILPLEYNLIEHCYCDGFNFRQFAGKGWYSNQEVKCALENPVIVHFNGSELQRPWHKLCMSKYKNAYLEAKSQTPWKEYPIDQDEAMLGKMSKGEKTQLKLRMLTMRCPNLFLLKVVSIVRRIHKILFK